MYKMMVVLIGMAFLVSGCKKDKIRSGVDIYTFTKDRVDQQVDGNQGYVEGKVPAAPKKKDIPQRTMIGVDVELPSIFSDGDDEQKQEKTVKKESTWKMPWEKEGTPESKAVGTAKVSEKEKEEKPKAEKKIAKKKIEETKKAPPAPKKTEKEEEEEWIK